MAASDVEAAKATPVRKLTKEERAEQRKKKMGPPVRYPFWFGGSASSMAACVTHPLDLGKF
ncbi:hypothetical protein E4U41_001470 [Claviceps citrina]|nr:hypothetical protein E4U41_001470 [Claviceps citrina]